MAKKINFLNNMALRDLFKKKNKPEEEARKKADAELIDKKKETKKSKKEEKPVKKSKKGKAQHFNVIKAPYITEKAIELAEKNQYVFKVFPGVNKTEIKKAIKEIYNVEVEGVRLVKVPPRKRRIGRVSGWKPGFKKAIVNIAKGQKIEGIYP